MTGTFPLIEGTPSNVTLRDSFRRGGEEPLSDSGKWTAVTGATDTGRISGEAWSPKAFPEESGAFWNVNEFTATAVSLEAVAIAGVNRWFGLWARVQSAAMSGYFLRVEKTSASKTFTTTLQRWVEGTPLILARSESLTYSATDSIALTASGSTITAWHKASGVWTEVLKATDTKFTTGFAGLAGAGTGMFFRNFAASAYTPPSNFARLLAERLEPWMTTDFERYVISISQMFTPTLELAEESGFDGQPGYVPAWGKLFNVKEAPNKALGYLGQYVGTPIPTTASEAEARELVEKHPGLERGTLAAVEEAIRKNLTGGKHFTIRERIGGNGAEEAYSFQVLIYSAGEMPSEANLKQAIDEAKPGGVFFTIVVGGLTYAVLEAAHAKYSQLEAAHTLYSDMEAEPTK